MKFNYPVALFILVVAMICSMGIGVYIGENQKAQAATEPKCAPPTSAPAPAAPAQKTRSQKDVRNELIASAVMNFANLKMELKNSQNPKVKAESVDDYAQMTRSTYRMTYAISEQIKAIDVNQIKDNEIGYTVGDLNKLRHDVIVQTLRMLPVVSQMGGTNICLWEGGCMDKESIPQTIKDVQVDLVDQRK